MLSAALLVAAAAFVPHTQPPCSRRHAAVVAMAKGFSKAPPPASKPPKKRATAAGPAPPPPLSAKAQQASEDFDSLKASGAPEYSIAVRTVSSGGEPSEWYLVGGLAVPRSNSEERAVSMAIFQNEDELLKGAYKFYPKLKASTDKFEYGYKMRDFPDDPWNIASEAATKGSDNPFMDWFNTLDNPLNRG